MPTIIEREVPLPLYLFPKEVMTDEELFAFCAANKHLRIERDQNKQIIIMAPVGGETSSQHSEIVFAIMYWNKQRQLGKSFDSSGGFQLPDGSMRSPDAAWITNGKWDSLTKQEQKRFLPFAPDFVVELQSPSDNLQPVQEKMQKWIKNGCLLGWLIVPEDETIFIYRSDGTVDKVKGFDKSLSGENVLPGFEFDLSVLL